MMLYFALIFLSFFTGLFLIVGTVFGVKGILVLLAALGYVIFRTYLRT